MSDRSTHGGKVIGFWCVSNPVHPYVYIDLGGSLMFEERRRPIRKFLGCRQGRRWLLGKKVNKRPGFVLGASSSVQGPVEGMLPGSEVLEERIKRESLLFLWLAHL